MGFSKKEAPGCDRCAHRKNCLFDLLDRQSQREWREMLIARQFRSGETVYYEGEKPSSIYICCSGKVKIFKGSRSGQQLLLRFESPGDLVGHISLLANWPYADSAEAMEESIISMVDEAIFRKFLLQHPAASLAILVEVAKDVRRGEARARDIAFKPARSRLAGTLLRHLPPPPQKAVVSSLKRKDLAEMSGLTVETTVRLLKDFENKGYVSRSGRDIAIIDFEKLKSLAGQD
jgi:CRP-like cAMP-binding protein